MILSDGTTAVTLSDDMTEQAPYWQPVEQATSFTLTGAMIVDESVKLAGRPLIFSSNLNDGSGWARRAAVDQLHRWACVPGKKLTLQRHNDSASVIFSRDGGQAVEAKPVVDAAACMPQPDDWMLLTLRLMTI